MVLGNLSDTLFGTAFLSRGPSQRRISGLRLRVGRLLDQHVSPILPPGAPPIAFRPTPNIFGGGGVNWLRRTKPFASPQQALGFTFTVTNMPGPLSRTFGSAGTYLGTFKGRVRSQLVGKNESVGAANVEQRDPGGNVVLSRCARFPRGAHRGRALAPRPRTWSGDVSQPSKTTRML